MNGNQHFMLDQQPAPGDIRSRNAFGYLKAFGEAKQDYWRKKDRAALAMAESNPDIKRAFIEWELFRCGFGRDGEYHYLVSAGGPSSGIAPWSQAVKDAFPEPGDFMTMANCYRIATG